MVFFVVGKRVNQRYGFSLSNCLSFLYPFTKTNRYD